MISILLNEQAVRLISLLYGLLYEIWSMYIKWILLEFVWTIIITTFNWNVLKKIILRKWICFINLWSSYHTLNAQCTNCVKYLYINFFFVNFANLKYFYIYSAFLRLPDTPYVLYSEISHSNVYINFLIFYTFLYKKKKLAFDMYIKDLYYA